MKNKARYYERVNGKKVRITNKNHPLLVKSNIFLTDEELNDDLEEERYGEIEIANEFLHLLLDLEINYVATYHKKFPGSLFFCVLV